MNVKKLRKLQRWILAEPLRFDMRHWVNRDLAKERHTPCGTVGCLAGMAVHMEGRDPYEAQWRVQDEAEEILGLDRETSNRLFFTESMHPLRKAEKWPPKFDRAYAKAKTPRGRARVAVRRIDHFIATKGAE